MSLSFLLYGNHPSYELLHRLTDKNSTETVSPLLTLAAKYRMSGDLWQNFLTFLLIHDENPYSLSCEMSVPESGSLADCARQDMNLFYALFHKAQPEELSALSDFTCSKPTRPTGNSLIGEETMALTQQLQQCPDADAFFHCVTHFYSTHGVGNFGLNRAFHVSEENGLSLVPTTEFSPVVLSDLWGYELQKAKLVDNTKAFLAGKSANNVLLYGDSGTGKSTCIKAILNEYHNEGLRIVEVYKQQFPLLPRIIDILKGRNYKFLIYMDDLSFEDFEIEYKYLKAVIEGGLSPKPENVLIYATSNRRHLIRESWKDRMETDENLHPGDTVQEKLSLSDRFGLSINFSTPVQQEYFEMVRYLADKNRIRLEDEELIRRARIWSLEHGKMSGRVAQQFIDHLSVLTD